MPPTKLACGQACGAFPWLTVVTRCSSLGMAQAGSPRCSKKTDSQAVKIKDSSSNHPQPLLQFLLIDSSLTSQSVTWEFQVEINSFLPKLFMAVLFYYSNKNPKTMLIVLILEQASEGLGMDSVVKVLAALLWGTELESPESMYCQNSSTCQ